MTTKARWWKSIKNNKVQCQLCPHRCIIAEGKTGICGIRQNKAGELFASSYGLPTAVAVDPIEKKPLYHFLPGSKSFSLGNAGCNLKCQFCQNHDISRAKANSSRAQQLSPEDAVTLALQYKSASISYTYNEPTIWAEYAVDISKLAAQKGLKNIAVTNGYISDEAFSDFYANIQGANVDLKGFSDDFYFKLAKAHLEPVLKTLKRLHNETDVIVEITTLLIPTLNDSPDEIEREVAWILENLGPDVPLHFSAFHPDNELLDLPRTPTETLIRARQQAMNAGLHYVYTGNIIDPDSSVTFCPNCKKAIIKRGWFDATLNKVTPEGNCEFCNTKIYGLFK